MSDIYPCHVWEGRPLYLSVDSSITTVGIATKLCIAIPLSVSDVPINGIFRSTNRSAADNVRVTACSVDFGEK